MKTIMITLAGGFFVLFLASAGVKKDSENFNDIYLKSERFDAYVNNDLGGFEEDVELGFDIIDYLPKGFNPVEGLEVKEQLDYEEGCMFDRVFIDVKTDEILGIEDIVLYEIEYI